MKRPILCFGVLAGSLISCHLEPPLKVSSYCPDAVYYAKGDGTIDGYFNDSKGPYYELYAQTQWCPDDYPSCVHYKDVSFCHENCRENEVFCDDQCINPQESPKFCGARGLCSETDPNGANYRGEECRDDEVCRAGTCACAKSWEITCNDRCVDPAENTAYCGARGSCSDLGVNSANYIGQHCRSDEICANGKCVCSRSWEVACNEICIDPYENATHCGASGLCTDTDPVSSDYQGSICREDEICRDGFCVCARGWEIACDHVCIDPNENVSHCGARGLCTVADPESKNYQGQRCIEGQYCVEGICKCSKSTEVLCDGSCIDPRISLQHCGAKGSCSDENPDSDNFIGGNSCELCEDGLCICSEGHHLYRNSCEPDDETNCGRHGNACRRDMFRHASEVRCVEQQCAVVSCEPGSFFSADGKTCTTCSELVDGAKVGDSVLFGRYRQLSYSDALQPIEWQILDTDDEKGFLLMSKYLLDGKSLQEKGNQSTTWETCTVRAWLNALGADSNLGGLDFSGDEKDSFIGTAFNAEEQKCIQTVLNHNYNKYNTGTDTLDRVFFLSYDELCTYFETEEARIAYATEYCKNGANVFMDSLHCVDNMCAAVWLTRAMGKDTHVECIRADGSMYRFPTTNTKVGVRPVLWIKGNPIQQ